MPGSSRTRLALLSLALLALFAAILWVVERELSTPRGVPAAVLEVLPGSERDSEQTSAEEQQGHAGASVSGLAHPTPETSAQAASPSSARLHASSRDAQSGAAIPGMRLDFVEDVSAPAVARITYARADAEGVVERERFPTGRWRVTASSSRHRAQALGLFETLPDKRLDLGRITLEPLPAHRGILRDENGLPLAGQWITLPLVLRTSASIDPAVTDEQGAFEVLGDLPRTLVLQVNPSGPMRALKAQRFAIDRWDADMLLELQLAAYQHVIVSLYGIPAQGEELQVNLCPGVEEATEPALAQHTYPDNDGHVPLLRARELQPGADRRRFEFYAAAGRLQVWGGNRSIGIPPTRITLAAGAAEPEFSIRVR